MGQRRSRCCGGREKERAAMRRSENESEGMRRKARERTAPLPQRQGRGVRAGTRRGGSGGRDAEKAGKEGRRRCRRTHRCRREARAACLGCARRVPLGARSARPRSALEHKMAAPRGHVSARPARGTTGPPGGSGGGACAQGAGPRPGCRSAGLGGGVAWRRSGRG